MEYLLLFFLILYDYILLSLIFIILVNYNKTFYYYCN